MPRKTSAIAKQDRRRPQVAGIVRQSDKDKARQRRTVKLAKKGANR